MWLSAALAMSTYGRIRPYCRLCPTSRHTPLPRSRSVVVEVTKIVDIDRPEVVIVYHVELVVAVLARGTTPSRSHGFRSYPNEIASPRQTRGQGQTTTTTRRHSVPSITAG